MTLDNGRWSPGIGDPTILGWATVMVYIVSAAFCFWAVFRSQLRVEGQENKETSSGLFWLFLTFLLIALGINKQLDLQTWLTQYGKDLSIEYGWYESRRIVQLGFIVGLGVLGLVMTGFMIRLLRKVDWTIRLAVFGSILLFCFILIRASSFHYVDMFFGMRLGDVSFNVLLEIGSLSIILIAAIFYIRLR